MAKHMLSRPSLEIVNIGMKRIELVFGEKASKLRKENKDQINKWLIEKIPCASTESHRAVITYDGRPVGEVGLKNFERELSPRECLVSYWVDHRYHGRGIATEALKQVTQAALEQHDVDKVVAFIHEDNVASIQTAKKAGYQLDGVQLIPMYFGGTSDVHLKFVYGNL